MPYDRLTRRLAACDSPTVSTLPDGSVDHFCTVGEDARGPYETRESFGQAILGDRTSFPFRVETREPGGQAVNSAKQLHALGGAVTCYGHLDAPVFDELPFETVSMGDPTHVYVLNFSDRDALLVRNADVTEWGLADLRRADGLSEVFGGDAICCSNWISVPGLERAFHELSTADLPRIPFVFDPGDIVDFDADDISALLSALAALQDTFDVVYSANRAEIRSTAAPLSGSADDDMDRLATIREETGITAAVMHARDEAAVVTGDEQRRVGNVSTDHPDRHTGGGDRFTGGLGHALACGWEWDLALACANACAVYYVESGTTGTVDDIVDFLDERPEVGS